MTALLALLIPFLCQAQDVSKATLYDLKSHRETKLYTLEIQLSAKDDGVYSETSFRDLSGKEVVHESGFVKGANIQRYEITRAQTSEKGRFEVVGDKIHFEYEGPNGKKKTAEEKIKGTLLAVPSFNAFVKENWETLDSGKGLDVRFAVWDRLETVGFTLQKTGTKEDQPNDPWIELRMKPTSFIIAALVDPIYLYYSTKTKKLMVMKGRVAPKIERDGKWKDLDAETVY